MTDDNPQEIDGMNTTKIVRKTTDKWLAALADDLGMVAGCIREALDDLDGILAGATAADPMVCKAATAKLVAQAAELDSCSADLVVLADQMQAATPPARPQAGKGRRSVAARARR
jgi:hypothetical protein